MSEQNIVRVHYFPRQYLRTQDFQDEQAYHIAMRRRHLVGQHSWGIVHGLTLEFDVDEQQYWLNPGLAIDGFGRELILLERKHLSSRDRAFAERDTDTLDVFLLYRRRGADLATHSENNDAFYRWSEIPAVRLEKSDPSVVDWRFPRTVPENQHNFPPYRTAPDDPQQEWPVYLGKIIKFDPQAENNPTIDANGRPYAGLIGETVTHPSQKVRLTLGTKANDPVLTLQNREKVEDSWQKRFVIDNQGCTDIQGDAVVKGGVYLKDQGIKFQDVQRRENRTTILPWSIYRTQQYVDAISFEPLAYEEANERLKSEDEKENVMTKAQLRFAAGHVGSTEPPQEIVLGAWIDGEFKPSLTIKDTGEVQIEGDLVVTGQIITTEPIVKQGFSAEAQRQLQAGRHAGLTSTGTILPNYLELIGGGSDTVTEASITSFLNDVKDSEKLDAFADALTKNSNNTLLGVVIQKIISSKIGSLLTPKGNLETILSTVLSEQGIDPLYEALAAESGKINDLFNKLNEDKPAELLTAVITKQFSALLDQLIEKSADLGEQVVDTLAQDETYYKEALITELCQPDPDPDTDPVDDPTDPPDPTDVN